MTSTMQHLAAADSEPAIDGRRWLCRCLRSVSIGHLLPSRSRLRSAQRSEASPDLNQHSLSDVPVSDSYFSGGWIRRCVTLARHFISSTITKADLALAHLRPVSEERGSGGKINRKYDRPVVGPYIRPGKILSCSQKNQPSVSQGEISQEAGIILQEPSNISPAKLTELYMSSKLTLYSSLPKKPVSLQPRWKESLSFSAVESQKKIGISRKRTFSSSTITLAHDEEITPIAKLYMKSLGPRDSLSLKKRRTHEKKQEINTSSPIDIAKAYMKSHGVDATHLYVKKREIKRHTFASLVFSGGFKARPTGQSEGLKTWRDFEESLMPSGLQRINNTIRMKKLEEKRRLEESKSETTEQNSNSDRANPPDGNGGFGSPFHV